MKISFPKERPDQIGKVVGSIPISSTKSNFLLHKKMGDSIEKGVGIVYKLVTVMFVELHCSVTRIQYNSFGSKFNYFFFKLE